MEQGELMTETETETKYAFCRFESDPDPAFLVRAKKQLILVLRDQGVTGDVIFDGPRIFQANEMADGVPVWGLKVISV